MLKNNLKCYDSSFLFNAIFLLFPTFSKYLLYEINPEQYYYDVNLSCRVTSKSITLNQNNND